METSASAFIRQVEQIFPSEPLDPVRVYWPSIPLCSLLLHPGGTVIGGGITQGHFVIIEDVSLRSANVWVYPG
jgi:hypothetical protein